MVFVQVKLGLLVCSIINCLPKQTGNNDTALEPIQSTSDLDIQITCTLPGNSVNWADDTCTTYVMCIPEDQGYLQANIIKCPNDFIYNDLENRCVPKDSGYACPMACKNREGRFTNPWQSCDGYLLCTRNVNGKLDAHIMSCPPGTTFDTATVMCTQEAYEACQMNLTTTISSITTTSFNAIESLVSENTTVVEGNLSTQSEMNTSPSLTSTTFPQSFSTESSSSTMIPPVESSSATDSSNSLSTSTISSTTSASPRLEAPVCERPGRHLDPLFPCTGYIICVINVDGKLIGQRLSCPGGSWFSPNMRRCIRGFSDTCNPEPSSSAPTSTTEFIVSTAKREQTLKPEWCKEEGRFVDPDLPCYGYLLCRRHDIDGILFGQHFNCPADTWFQEDSGRCENKLPQRCYQVQSSEGTVSLGYDKSTSASQESTKSSLVTYEVPEIIQGPTKPPQMPLISTQETSTETPKTTQTVTGSSEVHLQSSTVTVTESTSEALTSDHNPISSRPSPNRSVSSSYSSIETITPKPESEMTPSDLPVTFTKLTSESCGTSPEIPAVICSTVGKFIDPEAPCSRYILCVKKENGRIIGDRYLCPSGTRFLEERGRCVMILCDIPPSTIPTLSAACTTLALEVTSTTLSQTILPEVSTPGFEITGQEASENTEITTGELTETSEALTELPISPSESPTKSTEWPKLSSENPVKPTGNPEVPTESPILSSESPVDPTRNPEAPTEPILSTQSPVEPTGNPQGPTESPIPPSESPLEPTGKPKLPTETPIPSSQSPLEPTKNPESSTELPIPSSESPVAPTRNPEEPTEPILSTGNPVEPTGNSQGPTGSPMPSSESSVESTGSPEGSSGSPIQSSESPIAPTGSSSTSVPETGITDPYTFKCPHEGRFAIEDICNRYIICTQIDSKNYLMTFHRCPPRTVFSPSKSTCILI